MPFLAVEGKQAANSFESSATNAVLCAFLLCLFFQLEALSSAVTRTTVIYLPYSITMEQ